MTRRIITLLVVAALAAPSAVMAQSDKPAEGAAAPDMEKMMAEYAKFSTPGAEHKNLEKHVGKWTYTMKAWMDPAQPPTESKGTCEITPLLGGRFFRSEYHGDMMGQPFEGIGTDGYDIHKQKYVSTWIDNMGTMIMMSTGTANADGTEITYLSDFDDPVLKVNKKVRMVYRSTGPDSWTFEFHDATAGQPEHKTMEMAATRVK